LPSQIKKKIKYGLDVLAERKRERKKERKRHAAPITRKKKRFM